MMPDYRRCPECGQIEGHCMSLCSRYKAPERMSEEKPEATCIASCRSDGRCPECGNPGWTINSPTKGLLAVWQLPCGCAPCINWACLAKHARSLLAEALRQRALQTDHLAEFRVKHQKERDSYKRMLKEGHETVAEALRQRDLAVRKAAAERAMLDEILALPDIEPPTPGDGDNVAMVVANALEALREERDAAIRQRDAEKKANYDRSVRLRGPHILVHRQAWDQMREERDRAREIGRGEAWEVANDKIEEWRERADRAEALLREIQPMVAQVAVLDPYPVVRERASALLAKIREVLG